MTVLIIITALSALIYLLPDSDRLSGVKELARIAFAVSLLVLLAVVWMT